jgi:predicted SnoaL-like aldol condensation-catalyzing enzyme
VTASVLEHNKHTDRRFYAAIVAKDFDAAVALIGDRYVQHNPAIGDGIEAFKAFLDLLRDRFPGLRAEVKNLIAEDDFVVGHVHGIRDQVSAARRSSASSGWRTARSPSTGTSSNRSRNKPRTQTGCSSRLVGNRKCMGWPARLPRAVPYSAAGVKGRTLRCWTSSP